MKRMIASRLRPGIFYLSAALLCAANFTIAVEAFAKPPIDRGSGSIKGRGKLKKTIDNTPPTLSGTPADTVLENTFYDFVPQAADADGDELQFAIRNKPSWADFDPTTGALYGTPTAADVGTYSSIRISVNDGTDVDVLPEFTLDVVSTASAAVTLTWQPPTTNIDGTPLVDLAGYRIYYGSDLGNMSNVVELPNPGLTSYVVEELTPSTWYFAATSLNSQGQESALSDPVIRDLRQ